VEEGLKGATHYTAYSELIYLVGQYDQDKFKLPDTHLGIIDLAFEISRRVSAAYGWPEPIIVGTPLTESSESYLPVFQSQKIDTNTERAGFSQNDVNEILSEFCKENTDLCFAICEQLRRDQQLQQVFVEVMKNLQSLTEKEFPNVIKKTKGAQLRYSHYLWQELSFRIGVLCEVPIYLKVKEHNKR